MNTNLLRFWIASQLVVIIIALAALVTPTGAASVAVTQSCNPPAANFATLTTCRTQTAQALVASPTVTRTPQPSPTRAIATATIVPSPTRIEPQRMYCRAGSVTVVPFSDNRELVICQEWEPVTHGGGNFHADGETP